MSRGGNNKRMLVSITKGNLQHKHIYLKPKPGFFPRECYGAASKKAQAGRSLTLEVEGLPEAIQTDIAPRSKNGNPRSIFRKRTWVGEFFKKHKIRPGDVVAIERMSKFTYRIRPFDKERPRARVDVSTRPGKAGAPRRPRSKRAPLLPFAPAKPRAGPARTAASLTSSQALSAKAATNGSINKLFPEDRPVHDWYRFVLSFPPQLVREYLQKFGITSRKRVLDPFCGTGTTLVECKKLGIPSIGLEAHPMPAFASEVKTDWRIDASELSGYAQRVVRSVRGKLAGKSTAFRSLPEDAHKLLLKDSISPIPLHKTLILLEYLKRDEDKPYHQHMLLALANALITEIGNLHFGPEVGVRNVKKDAPVLASWETNVLDMASDISHLGERASVRTKVWCHDSRAMVKRLRAHSVDAVITSPPYPNEKDYTRTTRLETVILGFIKNRKDLRALKGRLIRSNTRNVYKQDDDDRWVEAFPQIKQIARRIEARRKELGKTSGFERLYHRVTELYFGGMARHFADLRRVLRPGAKLAYVVGDQASYLRVMIRTGQLLAKIAESLGYEVESIDLFRTRRSTVTREQLREEVVVLNWPG